MMRGEGSDVFRHCFERDVKKSKPAMEKRRRARINTSLAELRSLIPDSVKRDNRRYNKMEKADVLEMAVRYLRHLQETNKDKRVQSTASYSLGFSECTQEVSEFFRSPSPITARVRSSLLDHLQGCNPHKAPDSPSSSPGKTGPKLRGINDTALSSTSIIARCLLSSTPLPGQHLSSMETSPPTIVSSTSDVGIFEDNKINDQCMESEENTFQNRDVLGPRRTLSSSASSQRIMAARRDLTDVFAKSESESIEAISSDEDMSASENKPEDISEPKAQRSKPGDPDLNVSNKDVSSNSNDTICSNNCIKVSKNKIGINLHDSCSKVGDVKSSFEINENDKDVTDSLKHKVFNKLSGPVDRSCLTLHTNETNQENICVMQYKPMTESRTCNEENAPILNAARSEAHSSSRSYQKQDTHDVDKESSNFHMDADIDLFTRSCLSKSVSQLPLTSTSSKPVHKFRTESSPSDKIRRYQDETCVTIIKQNGEKDTRLFKNSEEILFSEEAENNNTLTVTRDSLKHENVGDLEEENENSVEKEENHESMADKEEKPSHSISDSVSTPKIMMEDTGNAPSVLIPIYVQTSFDESENPTVQQAFILTKHNTSASFIPKTFKPIAAKIPSTVSSNAHVLESTSDNSIYSFADTHMKNATAAVPVLIPQNNDSITCHEIQVPDSESRLSHNSGKSQNVFSQSHRLVSPQNNDSITCHEIQVPNSESRLSHNSGKSQNVFSQSHRLVSPQNNDKFNLESMRWASSQPSAFTGKEEKMLVERREDQERERCNRFCGEPRQQEWPLEDETLAHDFTGSSRNYSESAVVMRSILQSDDYVSDVADRSKDANKPNDKDKKERIFLNPTENSKSTCAEKQKMMTTSCLTDRQAYAPGSSLAELGFCHYNLSQERKGIPRNVAYSDLNGLCDNHPRSSSLEQNKRVCKTLKIVPEKSDFLPVSPQPMASNTCNSVLRDRDRGNILRRVLTDDGPIKRENILTTSKYRNLVATPQYAHDKPNEFFDDLAIDRLRKGKCQEKDWAHENSDFKVEDPVRIVGYDDQGRNQSPLFLSDMQESSLEKHHSDIVYIERDNIQPSSKFGKFPLTIFRKGYQETTGSHHQNEKLAGKFLSDLFLSSSSSQVSLKNNKSHSDSNVDVQFVDEYSHPSQAFNDDDAVVKISQEPSLQIASERNQEIRKSVRYSPYSRNNPDFVSSKKTSTEPEITMDNSWKTFPTECVHSTRSTFKTYYDSHTFNSPKELSMPEAISPQPLNLSKTGKNKQEQKQPKGEQQLKYCGTASRYLHIDYGNAHQIDEKSQPTILPNCTSVYATDDDDFEKCESEDSEVTVISRYGSFGHDKIEDFSNTRASSTPVEHLKSISFCVKNGTNIVAPLSNTSEQNIHENYIETKQRIMCIESKQPNRNTDKLSCVWPKSLSLSGLPGNLFVPVGTPPVFPAYKLEQDTPEAEDDVWRPW